MRALRVLLRCKSSFVSCRPSSAVRPVGFRAVSVALRNDRRIVSNSSDASRPAFRSWFSAGVRSRRAAFPLSVIVSVPHLASDAVTILWKEMHDRPPRDSPGVWPLDRSFEQTTCSYAGLSEPPESKYTTTR